MRSEQTPLDILTSLPTPRVWSMLVTIFGDLAQAPEDRIDGPLLTRLTDGMGIKPEAVRVALHRLRNEDWITSVKSGRTSSHALTARGRRESEAATRLIYAAPSDLPNAWHLALMETNDAEERAAMQAAGFLQLTPRAFVAHAGLEPPVGALVLAGGPAPRWVQDQLVPPELTAQFSGLLDLLGRVSLAMDRCAADDPLTVAILRCLIVHHWRRLVLRHPYLPPTLTGADWPGHLCRAEVVSQLDRLPRPALAELQADGS
jgi:phenylacetic acid degradation operon negative regulatory protein